MPLDQSTFSRPLRRKGLANARRTSTIDYQKLEDRLVLTAGNGLLGQYYNNVDLTEIDTVRIDTNVDFDWGSGSYESGGPADAFSVRWTGQIESQFTETYSLVINANDGARLWVNGQLLIDEFDAGTVSDATSTIDLIAGRRYDIQLEYRETTGDASIKLEWESASLAREVVPSNRLYASERGNDSLGDLDRNHWDRRQRFDFRYQLSGQPRFRFKPGIV